MTGTSPLLTIAIPTWNRAEYLSRNLAQLQSEMANVRSELVEVLVSDNCSPDDTSEVVDSAVKAGLPVRYVRNKSNLGWALNFLQCFDLATGKYVLLLGDDDLLVDGALSLVLERLARKNYGVVCVRPYGFDSDFRYEYPGTQGRERTFQDSGQFLVAVSRYFTLTSACFINKTMLSDVDTKQFVSTDLATFHLLLRAALRADENLFVEKYLVASKRQNSFSYEYANVFVSQFWEIIDAHRSFGLSQNIVRQLESQRLLSYYPFYLFDLRLSQRGDLKVTREALAARFHRRWLYKFWVSPIIRLPRPAALLWGGMATAIGRAANGDLRRGLKFGWTRLTRTLARTLYRSSNADTSRTTSARIEESDVSSDQIPDRTNRESSEQGSVR